MSSEGIERHDNPNRRILAGEVQERILVSRIGLGMSSALLPSDAVIVEIGNSWRHLKTLGFLGAWAVLGLVVAPIVLRRMARRESRSRVANRREMIEPLPRQRRAGGRSTGFRSRSEAR